MIVDCNSCGKSLEYTGDPPAFCGYCGRRLQSEVLTATEEFTPSTPSFRGPLQSTQPSMPSQIGNYHLIRRLGQGGMGSVYEGVHSDSGRTVAIKVISPQFAGSTVACQRFRQEGQLASRLAHPRCVFVLDADEENGQPYIVMEFIRGTNLDLHIKENGPLPIDKALTMILDVIDGLLEAHRLGLIHRDVKPSNCFLMHDGRVKIGDFGIAKAIAEDTSLTHSGTFLGTLLFAAPEQIKGEPLDVRGDVYSVAATLYYLLSGKAPFEGRDAASTVAKAVTEDAKSLRTHLPNFPRGLDKIILRGLERNRERRWKDLEDFRFALLRYASDKASIGGLGLRFAAYLIDSIVFIVFNIVVMNIAQVRANSDVITTSMLIAHVVELSLVFLYFTLTEGLWGCTLGKWLLRLRVCPAENCDTPGIVRAGLRALVYVGLVNLSGEVVIASQLLNVPNSYVVGGVFPLFIMQFVALFSTMRTSNGFRGLHEILSSTRVIQLPWRFQRMRLADSVPDRLKVGLQTVESNYRKIGTYNIVGALVFSNDTKLLVGKDNVLQRNVLLYFCTNLANGTRQHVNRPTRPHWISSGVHGDENYDVYAINSGCFLSDLVSPKSGISMSHWYTLLVELTEELIAASEDKTLPPSLHPSQIWVQANGQLQLLDFPTMESSWATTNITENECRKFLFDVSRVALQKKYKSDISENSREIHAPLAEKVRKSLRSLINPSNPKTLMAFLEEIRSLEKINVEVDRSMRLAHLAFMFIAIMPGIIVLILLTATAMAGLRGRVPTVPLNDLGFLGAYVGMLTLFTIANFIWTFAWHGGWTYKVAGIQVVHGNGKRCSRWTCAWRGLLAWLPIMITLLIAVSIVYFDGEYIMLGVFIALLTLLMLIAYIPICVINPVQSFHDQFFDFYLVPK